MLLKVFFLKRLKSNQHLCLILVMKKTHINFALTWHLQFHTSAFNSVSKKKNFFVFCNFCIDWDCIEQNFSWSYVKIPCWIKQEHTQLFQTSQKLICYIARDKKVFCRFNLSTNVHVGVGLHEKENSLEEFGRILCTSLHDKSLAFGEINLDCKFGQHGKIE